MIYCICSMERGGIKGEIKPEPKGVPTGGAQGSSRRGSPREFPKGEPKGTNKGLCYISQYFVICKCGIFKFNSLKLPFWPSEFSSTQNVQDSPWGNKAHRECTLKYSPTYLLRINSSSIILPWRI